MILSIISTEQGAEPDRDDDAAFHEGRANLSFNKAAAHAKVVLQ